MLRKKRRRKDTEEKQAKKCGRKKGLLEVAKNMLKNKMPMEQVVQITGLTEEEILLELGKVPIS